MGAGKILRSVLVSALVFSIVLFPAFLPKAHASVTYANLVRENWGSQTVVYGTLSFDSSYPTGGETITAATLGMSRVDSMIVMSASGYIYEFDEASDLLLAYSSGGFTPAGTNAAEATHTHAVALDSGASAAGSAHTHAVGTLVNSTSTTEPYLNGDFETAVAPSVVLTHNADCAGGLSANPLFALQETRSSQNVATLESINNTAASVSGATADGTVGLVNAAARFFVEHDATPEGVQIYVDEAASDRLEFVSPTATDAFVVMPYAAAVGAPSGYAITVRLYHDAAAATGKALSFDDNGAAGAQLCYTDAGAAGGTVPTGDVTVVAPSYIGAGDDRGGLAAVQTISGSPATEAAHTHASGTLADAASGAGSSHNHVFTGTAVAEAVLGEVDNATNLSGVTGVPFIAVGK